LDNAGDGFQAQWFRYLARFRSRLGGTKNEATLYGRLSRLRKRGHGMAALLDLFWIAFWQKTDFIIEKKEDSCCQKMWIARGLRHQRCGSGQPI
jgi:hypothetical protein